MRHLNTRTKRALKEALQRLANRGEVRPNIDLSNDDMSKILVDMGPIPQEEYETFWQDAKGFLEDLVAGGEFDAYLSEFHKSRRNSTPEGSPRFTSIKRVPTGKIRTYQVTEYPRMDVTDTHYTVYHGLTREEVTERFNIPDEEFDECIDSGYIGKDSENEWEIEEE